jgi:hypothetical protein
MKKLIELRHIMDDDNGWGDTVEAEIWINGRRG